LLKEGPVSEPDLEAELQDQDEMLAASAAGAAIDGAVLTSPMPAGVVVHPNAGDGNGDASSG
jgi:hypothetical protein